MSTDETGRARAVGLTVRTPYVGCDADGARRSARIDREEADTMPTGSARDHRLASAEQWARQAEYLDLKCFGTQVSTRGLAPSGVMMMWQDPLRGPAAVEQS